MSCDDTIAAQATPPGRGGIAIVRVSGPNVNIIIQRLLKTTLVPRQSMFLPFYTVTGDIIDHGLALFFPQPHSFTGEDVLELQGHGSPIVIDLLLQNIVSAGARLARPGEFSERAFLNGKIDLTQAEAIADLINASSTHAARLAMRSLQGEFSKAIHVLIEQIIHLRTYVEAAIDFTDEEIDFFSDRLLITKLATITEQLVTIQSQAKQGSLLQEGMTVVIAGHPNVGKSSLLNCLSGKQRAIVTEIAGTTRDVLYDDILMDGLPIRLIDTAGLRESYDVIEQEGIRRAYAEIKQADIIFYMLDATIHGLHNERISLPAECLSSTTVILIRNKIDLTDEQPGLSEQQGKMLISMSVKTGAGVALLKQALKSKMGLHDQIEGMFLARRRHLNALDKARMYLENASKFLLPAQAGELLAEDLRQAQLELSTITGEFTSEDLLSRIFSSFCIGK